MVLLLVLWFISPAGLAQHQQEGAHRIRKAQFPEVACESLKPYLPEARKIRYYRQKDGDKVGYAATLRKGRLTYQFDFQADGALLQAGFRIRPVDLPQEAWGSIQAWLNTRFDSSRIRDFWQIYPSASFDSEIKMYRTAFQNLLVPELRYEVVVKVRAGKSRGTFKAIFDSEGNFRELLEMTPPDHEHILY